MNKIFLFGCLVLCLNGFSQTVTVNDNFLTNKISEPFGGTISGYVSTTDKQPAAFVSVFIKENGRITTTDENGTFALSNLKQGIYTLEISMVGLKTQQKTVELKKDQAVTINIILTEDAKQLAEIVITSGRRLNGKPVSIGKIDINPMDLPQSIAVVGQAMIREQQALRLSDVMKNVNGIYITTTRGSVQESFGARGYSFGNSNLFKNGARVNSGAMAEMSGLERVEVLKGSAAILFGQVAPGGIVNMVTKQPKFNRGAEVSMRMGSYGLYKPTIDVYGPISGSVAYRLNGTFETAGSVRDQVHSKRYYINPSFLFKLSAVTDLIIEGDYLHHNFIPDFGIGTLDNLTIPEVPRSRFMGTSWQYNTTQQTTATASLKHQFNNIWKLNSSLSYQFYKRDYYSTERIQAAANGDWTRPLGRIQTEEIYYSGQTNLTGKLTSASIEHNILAGADADHYLTRNNDFKFPTVAGLPAGSYDRINILDPEKYTQRKDIPEAMMIRKRQAPVNRFGVYVQDLVKLSSKFNVLAGLRWSYLETIGIDSTNALTGEKTKGQTRYDRALSPRFGLVYKPSVTTSFFTSYSNSFTVNTGQDIDGNAIRPSIIDQYELGVKNEFFNGLLSANLTLYRIVNNNLAQTAPYLSDGSPNNNTNIKVLTGQTTSDGIEVDIATHPLKGLDFSGGYSYNFARYTKTDSVVGSFKTGERLVNNPAHTANASLFYTFDNAMLKGLKLGTSLYYFGDRFGGWNNVVGQAQNYSRLIPVKGFITVDVSAGYTYKKISLMAKVSNLTNTLNYYVHENYSINPIPPTQYAATVSYKF
ncbi:MAG: TonB-dependent siderophore receptor [Flavisolibacter sp.]